MYKWCPTQMTPSLLDQTKPSNKIRYYVQEQIFNHLIGYLGTPKHVHLV